MEADDATKCPRPPASVLAWRPTVYSDDALLVAKAYYGELTKPDGHRGSLATRVMNHTSLQGVKMLVKTTKDEPPERSPTKLLTQGLWAWPSEREAAEREEETRERAAKRKAPAAAGGGHATKTPRPRRTGIAH